MYKVFIHSFTQINDLQQYQGSTNNFANWGQSNILSYKKKKTFLDYVVKYTIFRKMTGLNQNDWGIFYL